ncbi:MAG: DUF2569 family protein [Ferruginibacter sp.]|nr:DUF2569 family protein [Cytophagales bacterium]
MPAKNPAGEKVRVGPRPAWVKPIALEGPSAIKAEEASDGYLYLLKDYQVNVAGKTEYYHLVRKIYSETGVQNGSEIEHTYDPAYEKLVFHEAKIIRDGQVIDRLDAAKFKVFGRETSKESHLYDGSLTALLILEDVRKGDLVEYAFSCVGRNPVYQDRYFSAFYLRNYDPMEKMHLRIISPTLRKLNLTFLNQAPEPRITTEGGHVVHEWNLDRVPGLATDADLPSWYNPYPLVWISEYASWAEVKGWALSLYRTSPTSTGRMADKIKEILAQNRAPERRLEAALRFVQDEVRYTGLESGISGYQPHPPAQVFEQRFGDCKDKSLLLCQMLSQLGIEAHPALVNTVSRQTIKTWAPSPVAFNHCIVQAVVNGKTYWYDPTMTNQRGSYQDIYCPNYGAALVVKEDTQGLTDMPVSRNAKVRVNESFAVDTLGGKVELSIETKYLGYEADAQRDYYATTNLRETEKAYLNYYARWYPSIRVNKPLLTLDNGGEFVTYENYQIDNFFYASDSSQPKNLECVTYPQTLRDKILIPKNSIRTMPIGLSFPTDYEHLTRIFLPESWTVTPEKKTVADGAVSFTKEISYDKEIITLRYTYRTLADHVSSANSAAYNKKQNEIINALGYSLTYQPSTTSQSEATFRINWMMVLLAVMFLSLAGLAGYRLYHYDPLPLRATERSENIGGWLILVAIGLVVSPFKILIFLFTNNFFDLAVWETITQTTSAAYNPGLAALIVTEMIFNLAILVTSVVCALLFFGRRSSFPKIFILYAAVNALFVVLDTALVSGMNGLTESDARSNTSEAVRAIVYAAIWIPYFYLSQRVKRTFVLTLEAREGVMESTPETNILPISNEAVFVDHGTVDSPKRLVHEREAIAEQRWMPPTAMLLRKDEEPPDDK